MSESDELFDLLDWGVQREEILKQKTDALPAPLEKVEAADFFNRHISILERSADPLMIGTAGRYRELEAFISKHASEVSVWRSGKTRVGIYIIITLPGQHVFVLHTTAVET